VIVDIVEYIIMEWAMLNESRTTHGRRRPQGFLPQLDEFYFTTGEKDNFGKL
jgi:hypothetical protein